MKQKRMYLPKTEKEFDLLVKVLMKKYKFEDPDQVASVLANRIQHLPPDQAMTTLEYLGDCVFKNIAYNVAVLKAKTLNAKNSLNLIESALKTNNNDQQALDALKTYADQDILNSRELMNEYAPTKEPLKLCEQGK